MIQPQKYPTICDYTLTISHDISVIHDVKHHETPMQKLEVLIPMLKKYTGNGGSVIIPNGVTSIHDWAFWRCTHLTDVTLLDSVKSIGESAFWYCRGLKSVTVPKRLEAAISHYKSIEKISYTDSADNSL